MDKIHIIDGNNFFSRVFFAGGRDMSSVLRMLMSFRQKNKGKYIFTFDTTKSERRLEIYPEYKAGRKSSLTEEEYEHFKRILNCFVQVVKNMKMIVLEGHGYEADDYIAIAARMLKRYKVFIHSTDQDFLQLINERINVVRPMGSGEYLVIDKDNFQEIVGVDQRFFLDFKAMIGDKSDNIPGIDGIGDKTAAKYINEYGYFDDIVEVVKGKLGAAKKKDLPSKTEMKFLGGVESVKLAKKLIDLSLVFSDKTLKNLVSEKVKSAKLDYENILTALTEADSEECFETVKMLCKSMRT